MLNGLRKLGPGRSLATLAASFLVVAGASYGFMLWMDPPHPIRLHVRWAQSVDDVRRAELERQLNLTLGEKTEGTTFRYTMASPSTDAIKAVVQNPSIEDTAHINRVRFRPELSQDRTRRALYYSVGVGGIGAILILGWLALRG